MEAPTSFIFKRGEMRTYALEGHLEAWRPNCPRAPVVACPKRLLYNEQYSLERSVTVQEH
jgi:hypothetical protein